MTVYSGKACPLHMCTFSVRFVRKFRRSDGLWQTLATLHYLQRYKTPFLLIFAIDEVMETGFTRHYIQGVDLLLRARLPDLVCADCTVIVRGSSKTCQRELDKGALAVNCSGLCFAPLKYKVPPILAAISLYSDRCWSSVSHSVIEISRQLYRCL